MSKQTFTTGQVLTAAQVNSLQANDYNQTVSVKTASYVLVAADKGTRIEFNTSGSVTCTVNSGLFDAGDTLVIQNRGAGTATVTAGTATVNTSASLAISQYGQGILYFVDNTSAIFFAGAPGDITGVTTGATSGLTGGVTSGTADLKLNFASKGQLAVGTGSGTTDFLNVGTNGYTLVADSSVSPTGLKWAVDPTTDVVTTAGDLIYGTGADAVTRLGIGTAGQVLTVNSGATAPEWATPSSGGYTQLATGSLTGSSVTISSISGSYQDLVLVLLDFYASSDAYIQLKLNNAGNSYSDTGRVDSVPLTQADFTIGAIGDNSDGDNFCWALIPAYATTTSNKMVQSISVTKNQTTAANNNIWPMWGAQKLTAAVNRLDILPSAGTFSAGTYTLYGVK